MADRHFFSVLDAHTRLGEGPVWRARDQTLFFVDITGRRLHQLQTQTGEHCVHEVDEDIGCVALRKGGGLVAGMRSGVWEMDEQGHKQAMLASNPGDLNLSRFNDATVDSKGRFVLGTLDETKSLANASVYSLSGNRLQTLEQGLLTSNGLAFSPDGRTLYLSDTPRFIVYRYDYDPETGFAEGRRPFIKFEPVGEDRGRPDGAAVDSEGCYWSALYEGGRVERFDPDGKRMATYPVPARNPTKPCFGGPSMSTLYVTTAAHASDSQPGSLYAMDVDVPGFTVSEFDPDRP